MEDNTQKPGMKPVNDNPNQRKGPKFNIYWIYGIILLGILGAQFMGGNFGNSTVEHSFQEFKDNLAKGQVVKVTVINNDHVDVYLKPGAVPAQPAGKFPSISSNANNDKNPAYSFKIGTVDLFNKDLIEAEAEIEKTNKEFIRISPMYDQQGD